MRFLLWRGSETISQEYLTVYFKQNIPVPEGLAQTTRYKADSTLRSVFLLQLNNSLSQTNLLGIVRGPDVVQS